MFSLYIIHHNFFVKKLVMNCLLWKTPQLRIVLIAFIFKFKKFLTGSYDAFFKGDRVEPTSQSTFPNYYTSTLYAL